MSSPLTNVGSRTDAYGPTEWGLTLTIGLIWGSAFLWIALGVDYLAPGVVAFARVALGALALAVFVGARRRIDRSDWARIAIIAVLGNEGPALLYANAQTSLDSAVAGMVTAGVPILSPVVAALFLGRLPGRAQTVGIMVGFAGIFLTTFPSPASSRADPVGVGLVFLATVGYAISGNLLVPLQQRYGGPAVTMWALAASSVLLLPVAVVSIDESQSTLGAALAVVMLGVVGTGVVRAMSATLAERVGAPRMSTTTYLIPIVAIILGVVFRNEAIAPLALVGIGVVLVGAWVASRAVSSD